MTAFTLARKWNVLRLDKTAPSNCFFFPSIYRKTAFEFVQFILSPKTISLSLECEVPKHIAGTLGTSCISTSWTHFHLRHHMWSCLRHHVTYSDIWLRPNTCCHDSPWLRHLDTNSPELSSCAILLVMPSARSPLNWRDQRQGMLLWQPVPRKH